MIGRTISHYRILRQLGEGGMGVVYVAEDTLLGRHVAIKLPSASSTEEHYRTRFLREARAISNLSHPHIAAVYDCGTTTDGRPFIVMELVGGQTLSDLLHASALTVPRAVQIVIDVAEALGAAHRSGVIHRDVKPSNVMVNERDEVKVLDFGLAKQIVEEGTLSTSPDAATLLSMNTRSDVVIGTPLYLSPEQARGAPVDRRSDLFALGALLYECVAGRPAFAGANIIEIGGQVLHVDPPPPSHFNPRVTEELDRITLKALAKKPEARYQTADELVADLRASLEGLSSADAQRTRRIAPPSAGRSSVLLTLSENLRRPRISPAFFLVSILLLAVGVWAYTRWNAPAPHVPPADAMTWYEKGADALRDGAYDQASRALLRAVEIDDKYALAHAALAEAWTELDYSDRANSALVNVSALVPDRSVLPQLDALYLDAVRFAALRKYGEAAEAYRRIVELRADDPKVHLDLGRAYEKNEEAEKAVNSYREALKRDPQYATAHLRLAVLYGRQQNLPSAFTNFELAEKLYSDASNVEGQTEVLYQRGLLYSLSGNNYAAARQDLQRALQMASASGNQSQRIQTLFALSVVTISGKGQLEEAEAYARDAVALAQANSMYNYMTRGLVDLGNVYSANGDYARAESKFREALELSARYKTRRGEAKAQASLGSILIQQMKTDEGLPYLRQGLEYYKTGGFRKELMQTSTLLARAYRQKGDYEAALNTLREQLALAREFNFTLHIAVANGDIGRVLALREDYAEALRHFEESYKIHKNINNQRSLPVSLTNRGAVLADLGRHEEARDLLRQAEQSAGGNKTLIASIQLARAKMALAERQFAQARSLAEQAVSQAGEQDPETTTDAQRVRALALAYGGASAEARLAAQTATDSAARGGDPSLRAQSLLALAEVLYEGGDFQGALGSARAAAEAFARHEQAASRWRALLVSARAADRLNMRPGARDDAARARELLAGLEARWGAEHYRAYLSRPDVQFFQKQLDEILAASN